MQGFGMRTTAKIGIILETTKELKGKCTSSSKDFGRERNTLYAYGYDNR